MGPVIVAKSLVLTIQSGVALRPRRSDFRNPHSISGEDVSADGTHFSSEDLPREFAHCDRHAGAS
jgi:hypothetical protein